MLQSMSKKKTKHTKFTNTKVSLFLTTKVNNKSQDDAVMQFLFCSRRRQCGGVNSSEKHFFKSLGTAFAVKAIKPLWLNASARILYIKKKKKKTHRKSQRNSNIF